ncbi:hypothetical protein Aph02nite_26790 [Actinoplanes philippinensis]|uniref:Uncharacterized protein n=1 Tax=Actinoplanes philippinensis TaxID=35752 RepID=A0A1I2GB35_9ACTN|nr:hypothetical protein [Actinoplanes philippinensis]GIE76729.1 hypothetical protein Aph02nite_26790 [Actinoplanes philippinensis]SFF13966.1 hypothetical protein SAMN05421541_106335 [Actinoplanes philippinensis]
MPDLRGRLLALLTDGKSGDGRGWHSEVRGSLERISAVGGGLLIFGTVASLLDVTGWAALALVVAGGIGFATAVGRWRSSPRQAVTGGAVALVSLLWIGFLQADADPDFSLQVAVQASGTECGGGYVVPGEPGDLDEVPGTGLAGWAAENGGIPAELLGITLTIDTENEEKVTLHDIRPVVTKRSRPSTGTQVSVAGCGGDLVYRWMSLDFDSDPPKRSVQVDEIAEQDSPPAERKPIAFPYSVSSTDPENFYLFSSTSRDDVEFHLEIDWAFHGRRGTLRVDDNGSPFRINAVGPDTLKCIYPADRNFPADTPAGCPGRR